MASPDEALPALAPGRVIAERFRLERLVGQGGIGAVWRATNTRTGGAVALKFLKGGDPKPEARRLLREARAASAVRHANVRGVLDVIELDDGSPVLVMEYLDGESLADRLDRGPLSVEQTAKVMIQVASGVGAAHAVGLVHRDLKPDNVFLVDGALDAVRVLDFGIAKWRPGATDRAETVETASGAVVGTPYYMSPEQVFGESGIDHRTDVWSLGLVLIECLSGSVPTRAANVGQVMKIIVSSSLGDTVDEIPGVPDDLAALLKRMVARSPEARPASMAEVVEVLEQHARLRAPAFGPPRAPGDDDRSSPAPELDADRAARLGATTVVDADLASPPRSRRRAWIYAALAIGAAGSIAAIAAGSFARTPLAPSSTITNAAAPAALSASTSVATAVSPRPPTAEPSASAAAASDDAPAPRSTQKPVAPRASGLATSDPTAAPSAFSPSQKFE